MSRTVATALLLVLAVIGAALTMRYIGDAVRAATVVGS